MDSPSEQWFDVLVGTSSVAMGIISAFENRYVRANQALADLYGMTVPEILSCDPFSMAFRITHPDEIVAEQALFAELAAGVVSFYRVEKRFMRADGSFRWGHLTFSGIFDPPEEGSPAEGRAMRFVVIQIIDITERKALEEALKQRDAELRHAQKIDGIGRLAAGVAHDFNNVLTVIMGHAEVLKSLADNDAGRVPESRIQESLDAILLASERAAGLTAGLLAHGRRERVTLRTFPLSDEVRNLQKLLTNTIPSNIEVEHAFAATGSIHADRGQIGQVMMNLVLNARDAIPGGGRIRIATEDLVVPENPAPGVPGPGEWVTLVVSDTGHGMSPEVQARIFEPFFTTRADRPGTQGTGLGLATVHRIVKELGGHIGITSVPGAGTTVTVFLPRSESSAREAVEPRLPGRPALMPNSQRVLVVEDEPAVRALVANVLLGAYYRVMVARDGEEALRFIHAEPEPFHLIVTDLVMPSLGGVGLARRLQASGSPPRMLFISGYSNDTPADLRPHGVLLSKPFTPKQLLAAVANALEDAGA